jgi:hypothetical protein
MSLSLPARLEHLCTLFVGNLEALGMPYTIPKNGPKTIAEYIRILSEIQKEFDYLTLGAQPEEDEEKEYIESNTNKKRERERSPSPSPPRRSPSPPRRSPSQKKRKSPSLSPRSRRLARQQKEGFGIFIQYAHNGIKDDEVVYNVAHRAEDRQKEAKRLFDIFSKYGEVISNETEIWEQYGNYYKKDVPYARVFFREPRERRAAIADANQIEEKYRLRIMENNPPRRKKY